jgi:hypothetical protein
MKYLILEDSAGHPVPILFPNRIEHEEMREQMPYGKVLGGGFVDLKVGRFICHGEAPALLIKSRGDEDAQVIEAHFTANGLR